MSQLSGLKIRSESVTIPGGDSFTVRALGVDDIIAIASQFSDDAERLWSEYAETEQVSQPIIARLLSDAPELANLVIALAADGTPEEANSVISKIGIGAQMEALEKVANLTFEAYGGPGKLLEMAVRLMQSGTRGLRELNDSKTGLATSESKPIS